VAIVVPISIDFTLRLQIFALFQRLAAIVVPISIASGRLRQLFYAAFTNFSCIPAHLSLFNPHTIDLRSFILEQDILYVGGGNTKNLVALWQVWELDKIN
jgi:hypothetical protein